MSAAPVASAVTAGIAAVTASAAETGQPEDHAPVVIAVGYDPKESWHREHDGKDHGEIDASIAVTQMMLQAADLGLGTTYVGMFRPVDLVKTFPEMEGLEMIAMLPLGYPAEGAHPAKLHGLRKPMEELVKYL